MDWTAEDTEILQLINRCRHLISVRDPDAYQKLGVQEGRIVRTKVSDYVIELASGGHRLIIYHSPREHSGFRPVLDVKLYGGRPQHLDTGRDHYSVGWDIVRTTVIPAIDREMVLEDLSMLGSD